MGIFTIVARLVEVTGEGYGNAPEPSFGTHFFQDLLESQIYPLAIYLDHPEMQFNRKFFDKQPNRLLAFLPEHDRISGLSTRDQCC